MENDQLLRRPLRRRLGAGLSAVLLTALTGACAGTAEEPEAATPARPVVWVANEGDDSLTVLDAATGATLTTLTGVDDPHNVQASASGDRVWVTGAGGVIQVGSESLAVQHVAPAGEHPAHVVAGPDGVLVTSYGGGALHDFTDSLEPRGTHQLGGGPHGMRVAPDHSFVAVANNRAGTVDLVALPLPADGPDRASTRSVDVGSEPVQVAITPDGRTVFVAVAGSRSIVRVDAATAEVTGRVRVDAAPAQVWATGSGQVLSANQGTEADPGSTLSVIDAETMRIVAEVPTGRGPHGIVVTEDDATAWVTNTFDGTVTVVDLAALEVVGTHPVGDRPNGITLGRTTVTDAEARTALLMPAPYAPDSGGHDHDDHDHGTRDKHKSEERDKEADGHGDEGGDDHGHDGDDTSSDHH